MASRNGNLRRNCAQLVRGLREIVPGRWPKIVASPLGGITAERWGVRPDSGRGDEVWEDCGYDEWMSVTKEQIVAGQAVYTARTLSLYDWVVLGFSNRLVWRCPTWRMLAHYNRHVTVNHLDVGVGTGYFLDRCRFAESEPRIGLMDLNPNALAYAAKRIARYQPEVYRQNMLEPITTVMAPFDSVGINYLLHCLPGTMESKGVVFDHLQAVMNPSGVLFGSTLLHAGVPRNFLAKRIMRYYNQQGIFSNELDDLAGLENALRERFAKVSIEVVGCAALFVARGGASQ